MSEHICVLSRHEKSQGEVPVGGFARVHKEMGGINQALGLRASTSTGRPSVMDVMDNAFQGVVYMRVSGSKYIYTYIYIFIILTDSL